MIPNVSTTGSLGDNSTEEPAHMDPPSQVGDCMASFFIGLLSLIGLAAYVTVMVAVIKRLSSFKNSFYRFLISLAVSDSVMLCLFLFYSVPATLLQRSFLGETVDSLLGALCNVVYFCGLTCIMNIAINRFWAVCRYNSLDKVYTKRNVRALVALNWFVGVCSGIPQLFPCCRLRYFHDGYSWGYDMTLEGNAGYIWYDRFMNSLTFLTIIFCYSAIFHAQRKYDKVYAQEKSASGRAAAMRHSQRQKSELRLAFQSALVALVLIIFGLSFTIIPELTANKWWFFVISILYILNNSVNPFLYVLFNQAILQAVRALVTGKQFVPTTSMALPSRTGKKTPGAY